LELQARVRGGETHADAAAAVRVLSDAGCRLGVFSDAPEELARIALGQLGASRRIELLETGADARERLLERLGPGAQVAATREDLVRIGESGT
jgi:phosphoglycolate phosphatase-like HAD superfamily hydrolase